MSIESEQDLAGLLRVGRIVGLALREMQAHVQPGITTAELDAIGAAFLEAQGARSAPRLMYEFPGATCISLNEEAAHGIPGVRVLKPGDVVNIDVSAELDGYFADTGGSVPLPPVAPQVQQLCDCGRTTLNRAIAAARAGRPIYRIGQAAEKEARRCGFKTIRNLPGHGVGRKLHEAPSVPGHYNRRAKGKLTNGLVITIEPFVTTGADVVVQAGDGWTLKTADGSLSVQYEHTVVITDGEPILVTAV